jgi:hypothetical protein
MERLNDVCLTYRQFFGSKNTKILYLGIFVKYILNIKNIKKYQATILSGGSVS